MSAKKDYDKIYHEEVIKALKDDSQLNLKLNKDGTYLVGGKCPGHKCGKNEVYISVAEPYRLACSRMDKCGWSQTTYERYPELFERLSDKYPVTPENPNAAADAYLSVVRGFPLDKLKDIVYKQAQLKIADGSLAEVVQFKLAGGHWSRLIDAKSIKANKNRKAMIDTGLRYKGLGWIAPEVQFIDNETIFIVEGIFHAIALWLAGFKAIAAISCNNLPDQLIEAHKDKKITWILAYDNDEAGRTHILKYYDQLKSQKYEVRAALTEDKADWDDVYKAGKLTKDYIEKAKYRGKLLTASSKESKAYYIFEETNQGFYLLDFNKCLFTVKVALKEYYEDINKEDNHDGELQTFKKHATISQICNCIPYFKYIEKDSVTGDQQYFFYLQFPNKKLDCTEPFTPSAVANAKAFCKEMLSRTPGGNFEATDKVLQMLRNKWFNNPKTVKTLPFVGYDENTRIYCFNHFGYKDGQRLEINKDGYIEAGNNYIKTNLKSIEILEATQPFNTKWFNDFFKVHHYNGLTVLAWWTGSLFSQQIKQRLKSWPFLEFTGEPNAGKTTLIRFLWALFGRPNNEGIKPGDGSSNTGLRRTLSQVANMPTVLLEADQEVVVNGRTIIKQYPWDSLKELFDYNGVLKALGVKTNGNDTLELIFQGTICISQNNKVVSTEATLTRIFHIHATKEHHTRELEKVADKLNNLSYDFLAGYLEHVLSNEPKWLATFFESYPKYRQHLQQNAQIKNSRIVLTHALVMAAAYATKQLFSDWNDNISKELIKHIEKRAVDRQQTISNEPEPLKNFWGHVHFINDSSDLGEVLNHSPNPKEEIAINMTHLMGIARDYGIFIDENITKLFPKSTTYKLIGNKTVRSPIKKGKQVKCWVFSKTGVSNDN